MADRQPLRWMKVPVSAGNRARLKSFSNEASDAALESHELPDLSAYPTARDKAVRLLQTAAAIEHALMIQYLYAGYSFPSHENDILSIAVEEMSHLMTVQNLLACIGAPPDLDRQDYGLPGSDEVRLFPFNLFLEPVSNVSLAKYVLAESPENIPVSIPPALIARITDLATAGHTQAVNRVATLYGLLGAVFGSEAYLLQQAATGDPWFIAVNALASEAAVAYGGRNKLHLEDGEFDAASTAKQGTDREWDRSRGESSGIDDFRVHNVTDRASALSALRDIGLQGEGPSPVMGTDSHFQRFLKLFTDLYGADGMSTAIPAGILNVPRAARIDIDENSIDPEAISHPTTVRWARLADHRYAILLGSLELYLKSPPKQRPFLLGWCFAEMYLLRCLNDVLKVMQRNSVPATTAVAAIPFNRPSWVGRAVTWTDLAASFTGAISESTVLLPTTSSTDEIRLLNQLLFTDARKKAEAEAQSTGGTVRTQFDQAREILDWAAGAGRPHHRGNSPAFPTQDQGRFWHQPLADLKATVVRGSKVVEIPGPGVDAPLIDKLRSGAMPPDRAPLQETDPEFQILEQWVVNGCPEDPIP